ncbi:expressed unknown protein [Seminavis robusta]|uniref:Uncharacterized protein n=1 Tax=Seminavis robusta TaxID=568900 RepID=A0A9N8EET0_9STRA|nr:expressed unknown protein [Seminavis robusta]|eukprot:Sro836_g209030.1 n/a (297) ;mRNA; f:32269-33159
MSLNRTKNGQSFQYVGKWTQEEEEYVVALVDQFRAGNLDNAEEGTGLRSYLAEMLQCGPKRVSKKYEGTNYNGRLKYHHGEANLSPEESLMMKQTLEARRVAFLNSRGRLIQGLAAVTPPAAPASSQRLGQQFKMAAAKKAAPVAKGGTNRQVASLLRLPGASLPSVSFPQASSLGLPGAFPSRHGQPSESLLLSLLASKNTAQLAPVGGPRDAASGAMLLSLNGRQRAMASSTERTIPTVTSLQLSQARCLELQRQLVALETQHAVASGQRQLALETEFDLANSAWRTNNYHPSL